MTSFYSKTFQGSGLYPGVCETESGRSVFSLKQPEVAENELNVCILLCVLFRGMLNEDDI